MKLLRNLLDYHEPLDEIELRGGVTYRTRKDFFPSVFLALAFGTTSCNERLAVSLETAREYFGFLPIIAQKEVADHYKNLFPNQNKLTSVGREVQQASALESEISTVEVLRLSRQEMQRQDLDPNSVLYFAHPAHTYRVLETGKTLGLDGQPFIQKEVLWSDRHDSQLWTIYPSLWTLREIIARLITTSS